MFSSESNWFLSLFWNTVYQDTAEQNHNEILQGGSCKRSELQCNVCREQSVEIKIVATSINVGALLVTTTNSEHQKRMSTPVVQAWPINRTTHPAIHLSTAPELWNNQTGASPVFYWQYYVEHKTTLIMTLHFLRQEGCASNWKIQKQNWNVDLKRNFYVVNWFSSTFHQGCGSGIFANSFHFRTYRFRFQKNSPKFRP